MGVERKGIVAAIVKWLLYVMIALLCLLLREQVFEHLKIFGVAPLFGGALCISVAMFEGAIGGGLYGAFCGYLYFGLSGGAENLYALVYLGLGALCGALCHHLFRKRFVNALLWSLMVNAAATAVVFALIYLMPGRAAISDFPLIGMLEIIYSTAMTVLVYPLIRAVHIALINNLGIGNVNPFSRKRN